jgi:hypothetical protein
VIIPVAYLSESQASSLGELVRSHVPNLDAKALWRRALVRGDERPNKTG